MNKGINILVNHKKEISEALEVAIDNALDIIGFQVENYARANSPIDTGNLRNSITHQVLDNENAVIIGSNVFYAPYQELGTSRMLAANDGKGFLRPAINEHLNEYKQIILNELSD
jgi:HK97 gp10 family phage protein